MYTCISEIKNCFLPYVSLWPTDHDLYGSQSAGNGSHDDAPIILPHHGRCTKFIVISQCWGCWWSDDVMSQGISIHVNDLEYCCLSTRRVNTGYVTLEWSSLNSLRPRRKIRHFPDDTFKCIFVNENVWIVLKISLTFVPKVGINNIPALVQIMAWRRPGDKPLSEPMMVNLLTHICVTQPQWVNPLRSSDAYMACRLAGAKPLSEPMIIYCQLNPKEGNSVKS